MVVSSQFNYNIPVRSYSILKVKKPVKSRLVAFRKRLIKFIRTMRIRFMKKVFLILATVLIMTTLVACGSNR